MRKFLLLLLCALLFLKCSKPEKPDLPNDGEITIAADESLKPIVEAQIMAYNAHYPNAILHVKYMPEQKAMALLMQDSVDIAIGTREATENEKAIFASRKIAYLPAKMALDGVALITNHENPIEHISLKELKEIFEGKAYTDYKLVFDNSNSSNLNYMIQKLNIQDIKRANIFAANGNKDVIDYIEKNPKAIGLIGGNWISDLDDKNSRTFISRIKVLGVSAFDNPGDNDYYKPTTESLRARKYPLERRVYLHTMDHYGLTKAFIRFCCAQIGQLVVEKSGLIPYYIYPKGVIINKEQVK
ncbi:PstS family phosphate ABC transporter substrate-binding protein [Emticicia sp. BO119]|uniref:PstS family phosphate ABC transporter substrate-binding protein n=1 Tax=Emticicia sp. BO119 TaxID=2757768 RepID=UPI0015EFF53B|nr:substrate-binding domain-containing protein [Emticicia sp. BO119]MBA4849689.1 substrate-binding domain-containing protein [Emticicia sp. BO119]